ncbi:MAG TPA: carbohydrate porin [Janthinobacterium sp.]|nr:carbohydrate porin [Janthinobacterium sp.]
MNRSLKTLPLALALAFASSLAHADAYNDTEGFHGYLRAGAGASSTHGPQSCFGLGNNTQGFRLGNECDSYFEGGYTQEIIKSDNGTSWVATIWADAYKNGSDFSNASLQLAKAYVEARNLPFLNGGTAWIGKRYYYRPDIHMMDMQYINLNGTGGGIDKINFGPGKISYAIFKDNDTNNFDPNTGAVISTNAAIRQNVVYEGFPVNVNGTLDGAITIITSQSKGTVETHDGWQASLFHKQDKFFGGGNTLGIQYGVGPGTGIGGQCCARMGSSGSTMLGSDVTQLRIFDDVVVQPTKQFSTEFVALWQHNKADNVIYGSTWATAGIRPVYAFVQNFKLQAELGYTSLKTDSTGETAHLTKLTIAPTISVGESYWSRPELRAFVTYGKWNGAATAMVNAFNNQGPVYGNGTSGTSVGLQLEAWW